MFDASPEQWNSWIWQHQNRVRTLDGFAQYFELTADEIAAFKKCGEKFRVAATPYYLSLASKTDANCPIRKQILPTTDELSTAPFELRDPLNEDANMPVPGLVHRYPDRALLYVSHHCPVYCRHCTRKRIVSDPTSGASMGQIDVAIEHVRNTPGIRDVIVSGGDPLTLNDERLGHVLRSLRSIDHLDVIRLGTRNPVTLPQRITDGLLNVLAEVAPIYVNTHFNHPAEVTKEAEDAVSKLNSAGCIVGNQMVLLRGVNDSAEVVETLCRKLLRAGARPYYMLQCDMAEGISHFRTPLQTGIDISRYLRGRLSGLGIPDFVVDLPGGGGKVELTPDYIVDRGEDENGAWVMFENTFGARFKFTDYVHDS